MLDRWIEDDLLDTLDSEGIGSIAFCPLAQGLLTSKYLNGVPADSRAAKAHGFLKRETITEDLLRQIRQLTDIAKQRGQTLAQMAVVWVLRDNKVTSALIGASRVQQVEENVAALANSDFTQEELQQIDNILSV